jgi:hypothetical protein
MISAGFEWFVVVVVALRPSLTLALASAPGSELSAGFIFGGGMETSRDTWNLRLSLVTDSA